MAHTEAKCMFANLLLYEIVQFVHICTIDVSYHHKEHLPQLTVC